MTDSFDGSQAFNRISNAIEDVIPNSGSLLLNIPIINLIGITSEIGLTLNLSYSLGASGTLGLPSNWSFGIPSLMPGSALGIKGARYIIDPSWMDDTGYASGLKYENNHGVSFVDNIVSQPLPYGNYGVEYEFTYTDTDGSVCYFDSTGTLLMKADRYGNYIYYAYTPGPQGNFLAFIIDSFGQKTTFAYNPGQIVITLPDNRFVTINCDSSNVYSIVDPKGNKTTFAYTMQENFSAVSSVSYPTGKTTNVSYTSIGFLDSSGGLYSIPAVSDLYFMGPKNSLLVHYQYTYGTQSGGNTFTGLTGGYTLSSNSDGLLSSNNTAYVYDVEVRTLNQTGTILSLTNIFYSFSHVPITQNTYIIDNLGQQSGYLQIYSVYDISQDTHNQQPNYLSPKQTQQFFFSSSTASGVPQTQITYQYDSFGNTTSKQTSGWDAASQVYVTNLRETASYFTVGSTITTLLNTSVKIDNIANNAIQSVNTLTPDLKNIASSTIKYSNDGGITWSGWKASNKKYDSNGREISTALNWVKTGAAGVQQTSSLFAYTYDASQFTVGTTTTDSLGFSSLHVISTMYGQSVLEATPSGSVTKCAYDQVGRLVTKISPSGRQTTNTYKTFGTDGENSSTTTNPQGYQVKTVTDPLGRTVGTFDNGPFGSSQQWRMLTQKHYDVLGNIITDTDAFGNTTTSCYNSLGKPILSTDPLANKTSLVYDFAANSTVTSINGITQKMVVTDNFGRPVLEERYPNTKSADKTAQYTMSRASAYDGFNNLVSKTTSQVVSGTATILHTKTYAYDPEAQRISDKFSAPDGTNRLKISVYDINQKNISQTKTITYPDKRTYTVQSDVCQFDALGQMLTLTNNAGQSETYHYDGDRYLISKTLFEGSIVKYTYTADGKMASESWLENSATKTISYAYDAADRLLATTDASGAVINTYSLDGVLTSITYPDGKKLSYSLDQNSRTVGQQDFGGVTTTYTYTPQNQLLSVVTAKDTLTYSYCSDASVNLMLGAPLGVSLANYYTETYQYDAQGRKNGLQRKSVRGVSLMSEIGAFNAFNKQISNASSSALTSATTVNCQRTFSYDAFGQVTTDIIMSNSGQPISAQTFQYDGNGNVLKMTGPAAGQSTAYTYNSIDQLITYTVNAGQPKTQKYDTNGRLVVDGAGNYFEYDVMGKLLSIQGPNSVVNYMYYPTALLATRTTNTSSVDMYYDNLQQAINTRQNGVYTHFLMVGSKRFASYSGNSEPFYYGTNRRQDTVLGYNLAPGGSETLVGSASYEAYGTETNMSIGMDASNNFAWNQEYKDVDNNQVYLRARFYDPGTMRFISRDSKRLDNRYSYGSGDPVNNVDPTGHDDLAIGIGVGLGTVAGVALTYAAITYGASAIAFLTGATAAVGGLGVVAAISGGVFATAIAATVTASAPILAVAAASTTALVAVGAVTAGATATTASVAGAVIGASCGAYFAGTSGAVLGGILGAMTGTGLTVAAPAITTVAGTAAGYVGTALTSIAGTVGAVAETATAATAIATVSAATSMAAEAAVGAAAAVGVESAADLAVLAVGVLLALL